MKRLQAQGLAVVLAGVVTVLHAAPYTPANDGEVVQRLPARMDSAARMQRAALSRAPKDLSLAVAASRAAIDRARRHGDPRELGTAQAALAPWWELAAPPPAVRLLRATVRQSQHQFETALADLESAAYERDAPLSVQAQAVLTRMTVLQVTGRLDQAQAACKELEAPHFEALGAGVRVAARACAAELRSLRGQAPQAARELAALAHEAPGDGWLALVRAELAQRMGDDLVAESNFRRASGDRADLYATAAYADWLLDRQRPRDVLLLLDGVATDVEADALLLRRAIALRRLSDPRAAADTASLKARFDAARTRGETFHQREEARMALELDDDAPRALALARANWARQKEPADAVLLWRAAHAAGQPAVAAEALQPLRSAGWADARLAVAAKAGRS